MGKQVDGNLLSNNSNTSSRVKLPNFAWFDELRPKDKNDIYIWKGKKEDQQLKVVKRHVAPLQVLPNKDKHGSGNIESEKILK